MVRTTRWRRRFWAAKTCSTLARTRARVALPRRIWAGIGWPRGLARWNSGLCPRRSRRRRFGLGAICRIGPHAARQVVDVKQASELGAIVGCGMGHREAPHEAVRTVDADMVLVAEHRDQNLARRYPLRSLAGERLVPLAPALQRPAAVTVDLRAARRRPVRWRAAALERLLLRLVQPRPAGLDHRRIDDLATHGKETTLAQRPVKALE